MTFHHGDRIRYATTGDDGYPVVRYGFVGGIANDHGPVVVMLDGELKGDVVDLDKIEPVHICNVTLTLEGTDLLDDPTLRHGLVNLWEAEAESAGLQIAEISKFDDGMPALNGASDPHAGYTLAELSSAGARYVLRAHVCPSDLDAIVVHAEHPAD